MRQLLQSLNWASILKGCLVTLRLSRLRLSTPFLWPLLLLFATLGSYYGRLSLDWNCYFALVSQVFGVVLIRRSRCFKKTGSECYHLLYHPHLENSSKSKTCQLSSMHFHVLISLLTPSLLLHILSLSSFWIRGGKWTLWLLVCCWLWRTFW